MKIETVVVGAVKYLLEDIKCSLFICWHLGRHACGFSGCVFVEKNNDNLPAGIEKNCKRNKQSRTHTKAANINSQHTLPNH